MIEITGYVSDYGHITVTKEKIDPEYKMFHQYAEYEYYVDLNTFDKIFYSEEDLNKFLKSINARFLGEE